MSNKNDLHAFAYSANSRRRVSTGYKIFAFAAFIAFAVIMVAACHNTDQVIKATNAVCHTDPTCWGGVR